MTTISQKSPDQDNAIFKMKCCLWDPRRLDLEKIERLRNENEAKTKTQSFNQYSENETKIWRQNILNQFNRVSSFCYRSHFVISLVTREQRNSLEVKQKRNKNFDH